MNELNEEDKKKILLSAIYLIYSDQAKEWEDKNKHSSLQFWNRFEELIQKHESQIDKISVLAGNTCSNLNEMRFQQSQKHSDRMSKANSQYESIISEIQKIKDQNSRSQIENLRNNTKELQKISQSLEKKIKDLKNQVSELKIQTDETKEQYAKFSKDVKSRFSALDEKKANLSSKSLDLDLNITLMAQNIITDQQVIEDLQLKLDQVKEIVEVISTPQSVIESICQQNT